MFTDSVDMATTKTAGSPVYSLWLGIFTKMLYFTKTLTSYTSPVLSSPSSASGNLGTSRTEELNQRTVALFFATELDWSQERCCHGGLRANCLNLSVYIKSGRNAVELSNVF